MKTFRDAVRSKDFTVCAEIYLRPETDAASIREQTALLKDYVDAILLTDNQYGQLHMSTLAAASILLGCGVDPVVQLTCRNRNRIALLSDLLGAGAIGVTSLLLGAGERAPKGFKPKPKPVLDLKAPDLIRTAATLKSDERLRNCPDFFVGGLITPVTPSSGWKPKKVLDKIDAGAQFLQMHICMDMTKLRSYMKYLVERKLLQRTSVIGAVAVLGSAEDARWLRENRPNVQLPDAFVERLEQAADPEAEGIRICAETIREMQETPGIDGVNIMSARHLEAIPEVLRVAGMAGRGRS